MSDSPYINPSDASYNINHLHAIIKHFRDAFPKNFESCGMKLCDACDGSGVPVDRDHTEITYWVPGTYCEKCKGFGVTGIKMIYNEYVCKRCGGTGCDRCKHRGTEDWISRVVKG